MADSYWRFTDSRPPPPPSSIHTLLGKRPRSDYVISGGHDLSSYYFRDNDRGAMRVTRDVDYIGASYDPYIRDMQLSSFSGSQSARPMSGGMTRHYIDDPLMVGIAGVDPGLTIKDRTLGFGSRRLEHSLPPDASNTLYVEGLPSDCTRREVSRLGSRRPDLSLPPDASGTLYVEGLPSDCTRREVSHIFRPFLGFKEVRLVTKEPRYPGGDPIKLCFVDFESPSHAATSMDALQGYIFDEHEHDSVKLRLGGGHRGKRLVV